MVFLVPGYVYYAVRGQLVAGHRSRGNETVIRLLCVSCVNFALTGWYLYIILGDSSTTNFHRAIAWTVAVLVAPAILGLISGLSNQKNFLNCLYERVGLQPVHAVPTSWDFAFSGRKSGFVFVVLQNEDTFAGVWGRKSFAADEPAERDLYLETVYDRPSDGSAWTPTNKSVLIKASEIRFIEFHNS